MHFIAFGFGAGYAPFAPGTAGSLVGALLFYAWMSTWALWLYVGVLLVGSVLGVFLCGWVADDLGVHDHSGIVWDEIIGVWWVFLLMIAGVVPNQWYWVVLGLVLFRIFDILKPYPIGWLDRQIKGGLGIMLDDGLAAVYAGGVLVLMGLLTQQLF